MGFQPKPQFDALFVVFAVLEQALPVWTFDIDVVLICIIITCCTGCAVPC